MAARNGRPIVINPNYELFVLGLVVLSLANTLVLLLPLAQQQRDLIKIVEIVISAYLLCDFMYRLLRAGGKRGYLITYYGWLDFVGSLPLPGAQLARLARLAVLNRKLRRADLQALGDVVIARRAQSTLLGVVLLAIVVLELGGLSMLQVEAGAPNANIVTASDALWWGVVTVETVGYGDRYPVTNLGRIVGMAVMTVGLGLFSVLTGFLADWFRRPRRPRRLAPAPTPSNPRADLQEVARQIEAQIAAHEESLQALADLRKTLATIERDLEVQEQEKGR